MEFNPDVKEVGIPDVTNVTRPISQPEPNKAKGLLFTGIGNAVKEAGEIYKDSVKVGDYNNKQEIENKALIGKDTFERADTEDWEKVASGVGVKIPTDFESMTGIRAQADSTDVPQPVQKVAGKLQNMQAAARLNADELDLYHIARRNVFLKEMRSQFPNYRDFVDKTVSKVFGGDPGNQYIAMLQKSYLAAQAGLQDQNKAALSKIGEFFGKGWGVDANLYQAAINGDPTAIHQALTLGSNWAMHHAKNDLVRDDISTSGAVEGDEKKRIEQSASQSFTSITSNVMKSFAPAINEYYKRVSAGTATEQDALDIKSKLAAKIQEASARIEEEGTKQTPYFTQDAAGNQILDTNRPSWSYLQKLNREGLNSAKSAALAVPQQIMDAVGGKGGVDLAKITSDFVTASDHDLASRLYHSPDIATRVGYGKFVSQLPEDLRGLVKVLAGSDNYQKLGTSIQKALTENILAMGNSNPPSVASQMDHATKTAPPEVAASYNRGLLSAADFLPQIKNEAFKKNLREAFFDNKNISLFDGMDSRNASTYYQKWSTPEYVQAVKSLGAEEFGKYQNYMVRSFNTIFAKDLNDLKQMNLGIVPGLKITYNDKENKFGVDVGNDKNVHTSIYRMKDREFAGGESFLNNDLSPMVNRLNGAIEGIKNISDTSPEQTSAIIHTALQGNARNFESNTQSIGKAIYNALFTSAQRYKQEIDEKREKRKTEAKKPVREGSE